jgi:ferredoxin, 2Fe-2S
MPRIRFINGALSNPREGMEAEVAPGTSILDAAEHCGARVGHACGGNLACSTCHVWVQEGFDSLTEITDKENDIMDKAFDVRAESRLGCQACVANEDLTVEITEESLKAWLDEHPEKR